MEIHDEYTGQVYYVSPEEEPVVEQLRQRGATTPEIVEALSLPIPAAPPEETVGYFPSADGSAVPVSEIAELSEEEEVE